jgi:Fungal protein kinase
MLIRGRRSLLNPTSFSTSVKGLLRGQMWSFCSSIRGGICGEKKRLLRNSRSGCTVPGVYSTISLSAFTSMGSCLYGLVPMSDHGCAVYSEPLYFVENIQHTRFLADFLVGFIATRESRGRDPNVTKEEDGVYIRHAGTTWAELPINPLCYRPCLIGRNIRVALVQDQGGKFPESRVVMKSTWEENLPPASSPPSEVEVLEILLKANVRGLPQPYDLESAIVRDDDNFSKKLRNSWRRFRKPTLLITPRNP